MRSRVEADIRVKGERLADLKHRAEELERELSDARLSMKHERDSAPPHPEMRTESLLRNGRSSVYRPGVPHGWVVAAIAVATAALVALILLMLPGGSPTWPASVAAVQSETAAACRNPDVVSEPNQVNFACGKDSRQILWVFALLSSDGNPRFTDPVTGRVGLEPISPAQGGVIAWSLNLHQPYNPRNPVDSLEVAARAINNIIGGATVTSTSGSPLVEPGLESDPADCARYTGSARVRSHQGFPGLCVKPVTSQAGQAALVTDVYRRWMGSAAGHWAADAAVLFGNSQNPGDSKVQPILRQIWHAFH